MHCTEHLRYTFLEQTQLLSIAHDSINHGLQHGQPPSLRLSSCSARLTAMGACFVTLKRLGELRGCIGSLQSTRALVEDVNLNAFAAAFHDPRFPALSADEFPLLALEISVLSPSQRMTFKDEHDLLAQLQPYTDGLTIGLDSRRATFLPSVWHTIEQPTDFLQQLKRKAGIGATEAITYAERYQVDHFSSKST